MKKIFLTVLLLMLTMMLLACEGDAHTHTWGEPSVAANGDKTYTCSGCSETKTEPHEHDYIIGWICDDNTHWYACKQAGCTAKGGEQAHEWGEPVVSVAPSETAQGQQTLTCTVCERTKTEAIAKLPAKMPREDWNAAFAFDNVRADFYVWEGEDTQTLYYLIDGDVAQMSADGDSVYVECESLKLDFDFSSHYDAFTHDGEGLYTAAQIDILEGLWRVVDVEVSFLDGRIESIQYAVKGEENVRYGYFFSKWGEVELAAPALSAKALADAFDPENFENYAVFISEYDAEGGMLFSAQWMFDKSSFYRCTYDDEWNEDEEYGTLADAGWVKLPELGALAAVLDATSFVYDSETMDFCSTELIENFMGTGTDIVEIHLLLENGVILWLDMTTETGTTIGYSFSEYGETEIVNE